MTNPDSISVPDAPRPFLVRVRSYTQRKSRLALWKAQSLFGKDRCNVCDNRVGHFLSLAETHPGTMVSVEKHGFAHEMETINLRQYSCPFCGATDRDRLFALYLDE